MSEFVQFTVGDITGTIIADGGNQHTFEMMTQRFPSLGEDQLRAAVDAAYPDGEINYSMNCLLLQVGDENILVDTGVGAGGSADYAKLLTRLSTILDPADVTRVIITHSHGDHINGLIDADGARTYPNAGIVIHTAEWEFWLARDLSRYGPAAEEQREAIRAAIVDHTTFIEGAEALAPGITALPAPGHTPGHFGLMLESGGERLLAAVDIVHYAIQFANPEYSPMFDSDPALAAETRRAVMGRAADENLLTVLYHLPYPGLGHFSRVGDGFGWTPHTGS